MTYSDLSWQLKAACLGEPIDKFFPSRTNNTIPAKIVCADCPVRAECLAYAIRLHEDHGVWGGQSSHELAVLKRQRWQLGDPMPPVVITYGPRKLVLTHA